MSPKRRRWLQYSLITLLVLLVAASIAVGWIARQMRAVAERDDVVATIVNAGGRVRFDFQMDESGKKVSKARIHGSGWLQPLVGDDLGSNVIEAEVTTDEALKEIECLPNLQVLELTSSGITDACVPYLEPLGRLKSLHFHGTKVSEESVRKLQRALPNCRVVREQ